LVRMFRNYRVNFVKIWKHTACTSAEDPRSIRFTCSRSLLLPVVHWPSFSNCIGNIDYVRERVCRPQKESATRCGFFSEMCNRGGKKWWAASPCALIRCHNNTKITIVDSVGIRLQPTVLSRDQKLYFL
jgi:hypothetical protein